MKPTVCRCVHFFDFSLPPGGYRDCGPGPYAAIITGTDRAEDPGTVDLVVFYPGMPGVAKLDVPLLADKPEAMLYWDWPAVTKGKTK